MRLIFTACSGRTGTAYLASLLTLSPNIAVAHEGPPRLPKRLSGGLHEGLEKVCSIMHRYADEVDTFVMVSHMFLKGDPEWWLQHHPETDLIFLTRPAGEIALSQWRRGAIPGRTKLGFDTMLIPKQPGQNLLTDLAHPEDFTDYGLCFWHALEMEKRQLAAMELFTAAGRVVYPIKMRKLVGECGTGFFELLTALNIERGHIRNYHVVAKCKINGTSAASPMAAAVPFSMEQECRKVLEERTVYET